MFPTNRVIGRHLAGLFLVFSFLCFSAVAVGMARSNNGSSRLSDSQMAQLVGGAPCNGLCPTRPLSPNPCACTLGTCEICADEAYAIAGGCESGGTFVVCNNTNNNITLNCVGFEDDCCENFECSWDPDPAEPYLICDLGTCTDSEWSTDTCSEGSWTDIYLGQGCDGGEAANYECVDCHG